MAAASPYRQLWMSKIESPFGGEFIPLDVLNQTITAKAVSDHLSSNGKPFDPELPNTIINRARKIFAILILTEKEDQIERLITENLTDDDLPLSSTKGGNEHTLESGRTPGKYFHAFGNWTDARIHEFLDKQWCVQAPVLGATNGNLVLAEKCPLPFIGTETRTIKNAPGGVIYQSILHSSHHEGPQATGANCNIAIKEFFYESDFKKEKTNMEKIKDIHHLHLIQHIDTFKKGKRYYVIFPWANGGDLKIFWEQTKPDVRSQNLTYWSLQQMLGLASALEALHGLNCRHGDLKPENIFHFKEDQEDGTLIIADFGVSKVHDKGTMLRTGRTFERATTPSHEPPEVISDHENDTPRSRKYDIWSMGCILLEFVLWLLTDYELIKEFDLVRATTSASHAHFYKLVDGNAEVHPTVLEIIEGLQKHPRYTGTALGALVELIREHLLLVKVDARCTAEELREELDKIVSTARDNPSYLFSDVDTPRDWLKDISWASKAISQIKTHVEDGLAPIPES